MHTKARLLLAVFGLACADGGSPPPAPSNTVPAARPSVSPRLAARFRHLDSALTADERAALRAMRPDGRADYQFRLGRLTRPEVQAWSGANSVEAVREWHLYHPEDLEGFVLDAYGQYLRGEPVDLVGTARRVPPPPPVSPAARR
jgi:hypothetical protein